MLIYAPLSQKQRTEETKKKIKKLSVNFIQIMNTKATVI